MSAVQASRALETHLKDLVCPLLDVQCMNEGDVGRGTSLPWASNSDEICRTLQSHVEGLTYEPFQHCTRAVSMGQLSQGLEEGPCHLQIQCVLKSPNFSIAVYC